MHVLTKEQITELADSILYVVTAVGDGATWMVGILDSFEAVYQEAYEILGANATELQANQLTMAISTLMHEGAYLRFSFCDLAPDRATRCEGVEGMLYELAEAEAKPIKLITGISNAVRGHNALYHAVWNVIMGMRYLDKAKASLGKLA